jgi:hypothetical protein
MDAPEGATSLLPTLSLEQQIALLPADLQELVRGLPEDKAAGVLKQLIQATELSYRALEEADIGVIKVQPMLMLNQGTANVESRYSQC